MTGASEFDALVASLDYPMFIVTTVSDGERSGCLVGFATQCSISPSRFLICISDKNHTLRVAESAVGLAVHLLTADVMHLARLFGEETGDEVDKFASCRWHDGPRGLPILDDCASWFAGTVVDQRPLGDHVGFVLEPLAAHHTPAPQAGFADAKGLTAGHEP
jgi:flavin reductase (DIM6/NTAB) family NADH-FMN oxidoreductase RutF